MFNGFKTKQRGAMNENVKEGIQNRGPALTRTKFGHLCKKFRVERGYSLGDQARATNKSMGYISQLETGRKPVTPEYVDELAEYFQLNGEQLRFLKHAADTAIRPVRVVPLTQYQAALVSELARVIGDLGPGHCSELLASLLRLGERCLDPYSKSDGCHQPTLNLQRG